LESMPLWQWRNFIGNDFEASIFPKYPVLRDIKKQMYTIGALYSQMSGSGATIYGIFDRDITPDEINLFPYPFVHTEILK
jgi:4-diphosphocytidyl-2C-methyl-D-erythritol 2-phosphate synthase